MSPRELFVWVLCALALLSIVGFLCYLLYIIFRQRHFAEIQKDFLQNMTHEFQTPLSAIQLSAEVLKNPAITSTPARLQRYAGIIATECAQLSAQVGRVLHMQQLGRGDLRLRAENLVWQHIILDAADAFQEAVKEREGVLLLDMPEADVPFIGDERHLVNSVAALLDNALKYCHRPPIIHIRLKISQRRICVQVQDNGIGIPQVHQPRIFKKFYRVPAGNLHDVKGFGLGLSYVDETVRAHAGAIICQSTPTVGTTFSLTFPLSVSTATSYAGHVQGQNSARRG